MNKTYFSKAYKDKNSAGNKAKTDIETILDNHGYMNLGKPQSIITSKVKAYFYTLGSILKTLSSLKKGDVLLIQYPFKKYYEFICSMAHRKGAKVITLIHDLGSFRRKKLTPAMEMERLRHSDYIIVHNESMKKWLIEHKINRPVDCLEIFDYLSENEAKNINTADKFRVIYAGALNRRKNAFLYSMGELINNYELHIYGGGFEKEEAQPSSNLFYGGYKPSEDFIADAQGEFGLVWDGDSTETCCGSFGEYMKYNNPHKVSFYIRCNLPVIIWEQAGLAPFVEKEGIGITISSLKDMDKKLAKLTKEDYLSMQKNIRRISNRLKSGYYTKAAVDKGVTYLDSI